MTEYRIVTNGHRYRVQRKWTFFRWSGWHTFHKGGYGATEPLEFSGSKANAQDFIDGLLQKEQQQIIDRERDAAPWVPA